jgi:opacity protein-like surface antigen
MKTLCGAAIALALIADMAYGADLPAQKSPPDVRPPLFTWSGFYVGFNSGYVWTADSGLGATSANLLDSGLISGEWGAASALGATGAVSGRLNGFLNGGQAGYNWQFSDKLVAGFEADIAGAGVRGGGGFGSVFPSTLVPGAAAVTSGTIDRSLEFLGTARGRLGYAVTPNMLVYATGGLAYGGVDFRTTIKQILTPSLLATNGAGADFFDIRAGWTIGAGFEWAFTRNLSAKLEYLYYDLGSVTLTNETIEPLIHTNILTNRLAVADATTASTRFDGHMLRAGLNYRFDWSQPAPSGTGATAPFANPVFDAAARPAFGDWRVSLMPYLWAINMNGSATARGETVGADASFIDVLTKVSAFPLAFMGRGEARNGPLFFYGDLAWMQVRFSGSTLKLETPALDLGLAVNADGRLKQTLAIGESGVGYELARFRLGGASNSFTAIDAFAGFRYWYVSLDVSLDIIGAANSELLGLEQVGARAIAKSGGIEWIDPVVGLGVRHQIAPGDEFRFRGDIGGFGAGSKFSWQAYGGYNHDFKLGGVNLTGTIGYRALSVDYSAGSGDTARGLNAIIHGPVVGMALPF